MAGPMHGKTDLYDLTSFINVPGHEAVDEGVVEERTQLERPEVLEE